MAKDSTKKAPARPKAEIAQEKLDVANRGVKRIEDRIAAGKKEISLLEDALKAAVKVRDYAALNPDLPEQPAETVTGSAVVVDPA